MNPQATILPARCMDFLICRILCHGLVGVHFVAYHTIMYLRSKKEAMNGFLEEVAAPPTSCLHYAYTSQRNALYLLETGRTVCFWVYRESLPQLVMVKHKILLASSMEGISGYISTYPLGYNMHQIFSALACIHRFVCY
jgi:hypothetical protein